MKKFKNLNKKQIDLKEKIQYLKIKYFQFNKMKTNSYLQKNQIKNFKCKNNKKMIYKLALKNTKIIFNTKYRLKHKKLVTLCCIGNPKILINLCIIQLAKNYLTIKFQMLYKIFIRVKKNLTKNVNNN